MPMFALAEPEHSALAALPSTLIHGLLVAGAIAASRALPVDVTGTPPGISIIWSAPTPDHASVLDGGTPLPGAPVIVTDAPPDLPTIGDVPTTLPTPSVDWRRLVPGGDPTFRPLGGDPRSATEVLNESEVDDVPGLLSAGPLRYPQVLREAGITGSVTLAFIIDAEGRVEEQGIEVISATHPGFVAAATETVRASRFRPARSHGAPVRVRVRQTVSFRD